MSDKSEHGTTLEGPCVGVEVQSPKFGVEGSCAVVLRRARIEGLQTIASLDSRLESYDRLRVGWLKRIGAGQTRQAECRGVTYPESYITKYITYTKIKKKKRG